MTYTLTLTERNTIPMIDQVSAAFDECRNTIVAIRLNMPTGAIPSCFHECDITTHIIGDESGSHIAGYLPFSPRTHIHFTLTDSGVEYKYVNGELIK